MARLRIVTFISSALLCGLAACGTGSNGSGSSGDSGTTSPPPSAIAFIGTTGNFAAWVNPTNGTTSVASTGSYAGKKQSLRGTIDYLTGATLTVQAGVEIYKFTDGHIYAVDLASTSQPGAQQISSETAATVDDTCSLSGNQVAGANQAYAGVYFSADLQNPTNSTYVYRLPGPDGVCNTSDDVYHMVKTGMASTDAPVVVSGIPVATVRTPQGGISGFVITSGATLVMVDSNFANPVVLGTFAAPIGVAVALPVGTTQGYPTGQLYVVDGNIVYVNYASQSVSASLFTIPNWSSTAAGALYAASSSTLYFSINTAASGSASASAAIYAMPANGSAVPSVIDNETGRIETLFVPVQGTNLLWGVANTNYAIRTVALAGGTASTVVTSSGNNGTFIATASTVYYESWSTTTDATAMTVTRNSTASGIVGIDGTVIQAPLTGSTFVDGGEAQPWPNDTVTTATPYVTLFQVQGLTTVTVTDSANGYQYIEDAVSGGTIVAIDATTNTAGATLGTLPVTTATFLNGTFRGSADIGFLEASTVLSTDDPATRDLYVIDSQMAGSLTLLTNNL
jgi:hypothetical protein